jgi:hypothetical protein
MIKPFLLISSLLFLSTACRKDKPKPVLNSQTTITITEPVSDGYIEKDERIRVAGKLEGPSKDYSFANFVVVDLHEHDTLYEGRVTEDGTILADFENTFTPGVHAIQVYVRNTQQPEQNLGPIEIYFNVCIPPQSMLELTKDDTSVTISWTKTIATDFLAYEVSVVRSDTVPPRGEFPTPKKIATITDINTLSFRHNDVFPYYKYIYRVEVLTNGGCSARHEGEIQAGAFVRLFENNVNRSIIYNYPQNRFYSIVGANSFGDDVKLEDFDPETFAFSNPVTIGNEIHYMSFDETGSNLNTFKKLTADRYQRWMLNLSTRQLQDLGELTLPSASVIAGVFGNTILYQTNTTTTPFRNVLATYNMTTQVATVLREVSINNIHWIQNNTRFVVYTSDREVLVYDVDLAGNATLVHEGPLVAPIAPFRNVQTPWNESYIAIGSELYDNNLNLVHTLQQTEYYIGLSRDGAYAVSSMNVVYKLPEHTPVKDYGDGFGSAVWFSTDNSTMYQLTPANDNAVWRPADRFFRYRWR